MSKNKLWCVGVLSAFVWACGDVGDGQDDFGVELEEQSAAAEEKSDAELSSAAAADEVAPVEQEAAIDGNVGTVQEALNDYYAVGIVPMDITGGQVCPSDSRRVTFTWDTEDTGSDTSWDSEWQQPSDPIAYTTEYPYNVTLSFCKVSGEQFKPKRRSGTTTYDAYAVLKLGTKCPINSREKGYYVDAEDTHYNSDQYFSYSGPIAPNTINRYGVSFKFCVFNDPVDSTASMTSFPSLGVPYAVFGDYDNPPPYAYAKRFIYTDDENTSNANKYVGTSDAWMSDFNDFVDKWGSATYFEFLQVRP